MRMGQAFELTIAFIQRNHNNLQRHIPIKTKLSISHMNSTSPDHKNAFVSPAHSYML